MTDPEEIRQAAVALLARREHSRHELVCKLRRRGVEEDLAREVLDELAAEGLQSDERFAEAYIAARRARGFGALRIRMELRERGLADGLIERHLVTPENELERVEEVRRKRFGPRHPTDYRERARQARFLEYRGFSTEQIRRLFKEGDWG